MNENLVTLTKEYLSKAEEAKIFILRGLGLKTKEDLLEFRGRMPTGVFYLDHMKHTFTFHGRGCRYFNENYNEPIPENRKYLNIDMEIGYDDKWCGISPWMLHKFITAYYPKFKEQFSEKTIKQEMEDGKKQKIIYEKYDLYYFQE